VHATHLSDYTDGWGHPHRISSFSSSDTYLKFHVASVSHIFTASSFDLTSLTDGHVIMLLGWDNPTRRVIVRLHREPAKIRDQLSGSLSRQETQAASHDALDGALSVMAGRGVYRLA
jgi:hypothetical protein